MANLNVDLDYFESPAVIRLAIKLGKDAAIMPLRLWCFVGKHFPESGVLTGYGPLEVESIAGWRGSPGEMIAVMLHLGLLAQDGETFRIPGWLEDQGHIAAFKCRSKAAAIARWHKAKTMAAHETGIIVSNATSIAASITPSNAPALPALPASSSSGVPPDSAAAEIVESLKAAGIGEPARQQLAALAGITPEIINRQARIARETGKHVGAMVNNIRAAVEALDARKYVDTPEQRRAKAWEENRIAREKRNQ